MIKLILMKIDLYECQTECVLTNKSVSTNKN